MKQRIILAVLFSVVSCLMAFGVPAIPHPFPVVQPNGDTLMVRLQGDEHFHFHLTEDGYTVAQNDQGYYCYAQWRTFLSPDGREYLRAVPTRKKAHNEDQRTRCEQRWLKRHCKKAILRDRTED